MRALISKVLTGSMIAGAALMVSACGPKAETTTDNTMVTNMDATEGMDTMSDNMTAVDSSMGNDTSMGNGMMSNDTSMMSNDSSMMSNDTSMSSNTAM